MSLRVTSVVAHGLAALALFALPGCFGEWGGATGTEASPSTSSGPGPSPTTTGANATTTEAGTTTEASATGTSTAVTSSTGDSTGAALTCEHLDVLFLVDVSASMGAYGLGLQNVFVALGAGEGSVFDEVDAYHVGVTLNAPVALNDGAVGVPAGQTCTELGALVRGNTDCVDGLGGRPYVSTEDNLILGLGCLVAPFTVGELPPLYEGRQTLDALEATLLSDGDAALSVCNAGFHEPGDPLLVVIVVDDEDASSAGPNSYLPTIIGSQAGDSLRNVGVLLIGGDTSSCGGGEDETTGTGTGGQQCDAVPSCRVQSFLDQAFTGLEGHVLSTGLCRANSDEPAVIAEEIRGQLSELYAKICG